MLLTNNKRSRPFQFFFWCGGHLATDRSRRRPKTEPVGRNRVGNAIRQQKIVRDGKSGPFFFCQNKKKSQSQPARYWVNCDSLCYGHSSSALTKSNLDFSLAEPEGSTGRDRFARSHENRCRKSNFAWHLHLSGPRYSGRDSARLYNYRLGNRYTGNHL